MVIFKPSEAKLPTGTVTYILADIEGSVRLWEGQTADMGDALALLDEVVTELVAEHDGVKPIEQGEGDSFLAVFGRASDAVECALHIQRRMRGLQWPGEEPLKVRMALHTGEAQLRAGIHYVGRAINRCARLRDMAHGGQIVLSQSTYELVLDRLPEETTLKHLGSHRLRDLDRPERVWQLVHPEIPFDFPPLRSLDTLPNNLPLQLTSFVGRESEISTVTSLVSSARLVTITGAGGCGKTRLALQVAAELLEEFPDGVWLVDLAAISDPESVIQAVASTLAVQEEQFLGILESIVRTIGRRKILVVFDNCEHLIASTASLAERLLKRCPGLKLLATSREPLGIPGENPWRVPSMELPQKDDLNPATLSTYESVQLFIDRAAASRPNFSLSEENAAAICGICLRLEGIPLAIELAAARIRALTPQQICDGLNDRFRLLTAGARTTVPRHQTLEASVDWSYDLLSEHERRLFRRISIFAGGFTLEAAEQVTSGGEIETYEVLDLLFHLIDKSLVLVEEEQNLARYRFLGTIRQYAAEKLSQSDEQKEIARKHRDYFMAMVREAEPELASWGQDVWADKLQAEHDNLRAALRWSESDQEPEILLSFASSLFFFWLIRGYSREGRRWLDISLKVGEESDPALRAKALWALSNMLLGVFDIPNALQRAQQSLNLARDLGDKQAIARALDVQAWLATFFGGLPMAKPLFEESIELARESGDQWTLAHALQGAGNMYMWSGDPASARKYLESSVDVAAASGDRSSLRGASVYLGGAAMWQGEFKRGKALLEQAIKEAREAKDRNNLTTGLYFLSPTLLMSGDYDGARLAGEELLQYGREGGNPLIESGALFTLGLVESATGDPEVGVERLTEGLELIRPMRQAFWDAFFLIGLASAEISAGRLENARRHMDEALTKARTTKTRWLVSRALWTGARLAREEGSPEEGEDDVIEALLLQQEIGDKAGMVDSLEAYAWIHFVKSDLDRSAAMFAAAESLREEVGYAHFGLEKIGHDSDLTALKDKLGEEAFEAAWSRGKSLPIGEVIVYALNK